MSYCIIHDLDHDCEYTAPNTDYTNTEMRILAFLGPEYIALVHGIATGTNPLLSAKVRGAVANIFKGQAITGPFPIVDALLNAIWEALKNNDRTL